MPMVCLDAGHTGSKYSQSPVGIFATDSDTGAETLCLYANAGADAEEIPPGNLRQVYERLVFILRLGASKDITFTWSGNQLYPTLEEFEREIAQLDGTLLLLRQDINPAAEITAPRVADSVVLSDSSDGGKKEAPGPGDAQVRLRQRICPMGARTNYRFSSGYAAHGA